MFDDFDDDLLEHEPMNNAGGEELKPPREMSICVGHQESEDYLLNLINENKMPHALIFSGPQGIGKSTLAYRLARYLLKTGTSADSADGGLFGDELPKDEADSLFIDPSETTFSQVSSGGHPDLLTIGRKFDEKKGVFKGTVEVDEVRKITPFMRMTASGGGWRIVIVDDADTMNRNSQNAILKILEEPPDNALIILITHRLGAMIPTIRSRARVINLMPLAYDDFKELLAKNYGGMADDDMQVLYNISEGSIGRALRIADEGGLESVSKVMALLNSWPEWQWSQIHMLAEAMGRNGQEESLKVFEEVFMWIINSLLRAKARAELPKAPLNNEVTARLLSHYSLVDWIEIAGNMQTHFDTVSSASLDRRHAIIGAFGLFKEAA